MAIRLIHWNEDEGLERQKQLEALGFDARYDFCDGPEMSRILRGGDAPDAVVIDLSKRPSHGREIARHMRTTKAMRQWPLVFVDGEPEKVQVVRDLLPDATYTTWGRIKTALPKAIKNPPKKPVLPPADLLSTKPTVAKLGIKPGQKVCLLGSPKGFADTLKPKPAKVTFTAKADKTCGFFLGFARSNRDLQGQLSMLRPFVDQQIVWLAWPKKASGIKTDVDGNSVRIAGLAAGLVDFKVCSIDDTWSGLAFKRRK